MCERQESLVSYVYDEITDVERREFEAHLSTCVECRVELEGLRSTRMHLSLWAPPTPDLGFRVVRGGHEPAPALPRRRLAPAFALAAAAVIVLAAAAAIANIEVRYGTDGMVVRTGWARAESTTTTQTPVSGDPVRTVSSTRNQEEFGALEARLRDLEAAVANAGSSTAPIESSPRMSDAEILRRVREMVREAELRQEGAVARRLLQVVSDFDQQRRADFAMIRQNFGEYQGATNAEITHQMNRLLRVAAGQEK